MSHDGSGWDLRLDHGADGLDGWDWFLDLGDTPPPVDDDDDGDGDGGGPVDEVLPAARFSQVALGVQENAGTFPLEVVLEDQHSQDIRVTIALEPDAGVGFLTPGEDFAWPGDRELVIPSGALSATLNVALVDDADTEPNESARFTITGSVEDIDDDPLTGPLASPNTTTVTVQSSDQVGITVSWNIQAAVLIEGETLDTVEIVLSEPSLVDVTVEVFQQSGSATPGADYVDVEETYTIPAGDTSLPFPLVGIADGQGNETVETFVLELTNATNATVAGTNRLGIALYDIQVLEPPVLGFQVSEVVIGEAGSVAPASAMVTATVQNPDNFDESLGMTVDVSVFDGTAALNSDFTVSATTVTLLPFENSVSFMVTALDDAELESVEDAIIRLTNPVGGSVDLTKSEIELTILDDDGVAVGDDLRPTFTYPSEAKRSSDSDAVTLLVEIQREHTEDVTLFFDFYSPNAEVDVHFQPPPVAITITAGSRFAFESFNLLPAATATTLRHLVIEMVSVTHGQFGQIRRHVVIMQGDTDDLGLIPPEPPVPGLDDLRIYADRIETVASNVVIDTVTFDPSQVWRTLRDISEAIHVARNGTGVRWMDEGQPVICRIMEDIAVGIFFGGRRVSGSTLIWGYDAAEIRGVRDLWFIGEDQGGGVRPKIPRIVLRQAEQDTGAACPIDNVHFLGIDLRDQQQACVQGNTNDNVDPFIQGRLRFHQCDIGTPDDVSLIAQSGYMKWCIRVMQAISWWVTDCTFSAVKEHSLYDNNGGPIIVFARNVTAPGTGRTQCQRVSRPLEMAGTPAYGLCIIADNVIDDAGEVFGSGAKAWSMYGFCGDIYWRRNTATGGSNSTNDRGGACVIASEAQPSGYYLMEWPPLAGTYFMARRVSIDGDDFVVDPGDSLRGERMSFSGCFELHIGDFTSTMDALTDPLIWFNTSAELPPFVLDQLNRDIGPLVGFRAFNQEGGVTFTGPTNGDLLSYSGVAVSTRKYTHYTLASGGDLRRDFDQTDNSLDVVSYDGSDPA